MLLSLVIRKKKWAHRLKCSDVSIHQAGDTASGDVGGGSGGFDIDFDVVNGKSSPQITRNFALYKAIKRSYEENIKTIDFDRLIDEVDRGMSSTLCVALRDADAYKQSLFKTKIVVPHLSSSIDQILFNVTHASDEVIRRYKYFYENWSELIQDLSTIPETLHPYLLPMIRDRSAQTALSFTRFINREVEKIESSILLGSMKVSQFYI